MSLTYRLPLSLLLCFQALPAHAVQDGPEPARDRILDAVTFADQPGTLFIPLREMAGALGWRVEWDAQSRTVSLAGRRLPEGRMRRLFDGTALIPLREAEAAGAELEVAASGREATLRTEELVLRVRRGEKRVAINRAGQRLRAWQGDRLVMETRVSTGRRGMATPRGSFRAGPIKSRLLISRKYGNARMPWSVQVHGNVVIHGYPSVPRYAASHGCIRMPLWGRNAAKWFYEWVDVGTPIRIADGWALPTPANPGASGSTPSALSRGARRSSSAP